MTAPYTKLDKPLSELSLVCRGCLAESGEMKNILEWGLLEDFYKFTNVEINKSEGLSELLCTSCVNSLVKCKTFREQCQKSDSILKDTAKKKNILDPSDSNDDIVNIDNQNTENSITCILDHNKLLIKILAPNMDLKIHLTCPFANFKYCKESFIKKRNLMMHLCKFHEIKETDFSIELRYYCSFNTCSYYIKSASDKFFTERKFLNQHFNKVHKTKDFLCLNCNFSCSTIAEFYRHLQICNTTYICQICNAQYKNNESLLVHLKRKHPKIHEEYKSRKRMRKTETVTDPNNLKEDNGDIICDSPKRSFATQTQNLEENIRNDVTLPSWQAKTDEISTQTVFEDLLSLKSQTSEDEALFFSETVSLSDIQTQTFPIEFGLSRSNKETITNETQSPDLSIKETQTCYCLYDSPKLNSRVCDSVASSPSSINLTSTETQTTNVKSDVLLSFNSAETQTGDENSVDL